MERKATCHSYWLLSVIKMRQKLEKQYERRKLRSFSALGVYFFFCFICTFFLPFELWREWSRAKGKDKHTVYYLWLHQAVYMCSQSVTLIVDIYLSLITWLRIGGHLYKTVKREDFMWNKSLFHHLFVIYHRLLMCSLILQFNASHCVSSRCCSSNVNPLKEP